jgi:hypothetical protein
MSAYAARVNSPMPSLILDYRASSSKLIMMKRWRGKESVFAGKASQRMNRTDAAPTTTAVLKKRTPNADRQKSKSWTGTGTFASGSEEASYWAIRALAKPGS